MCLVWKPPECVFACCAVLSLLQPQPVAHALGGAPFKDPDAGRWRLHSLFLARRCLLLFCSTGGQPQGLTGMRGNEKKVPHKNGSVPLFHHHQNLYFFKSPITTAAWKLGGDSIGSLQDGWIQEMDGTRRSHPPAKFNNFVWLTYSP